ncbi:MAG: thiamine phosphate synthase [Gammaproteobacteria bacterium]|nr:thiamine phosphate synthase [Gammaproteobacteria bacterium]
MNPLCGLYAITSAAVCVDGMRLLDSVEAAVLGGARLVQYRDKHSPPALMLRQARLLVGLCHRLGARLIVNDEPQLAAAAGADGVHLGGADAPVASARALLGPRAIIGASCGRSLDYARDAAAAGADYLAFGRFFASRTKPQAPQAAVEVLRDARVEFDRPLCAIGGITPANAAPLLAAGADLIAAVDGVFGAADVRAAAAAYAKLFD